MAEQTTVERTAETKANKVTKIGLVVSAAMNKTITVKIDSMASHKQYKKIVHKSKKYLVHDEQSQAGVGDTVKIIECRPLSKNKSWRLLEIISKAK